VVVFVLVGLLAACVALVASVQRSVAKLAQLQQMRVLAEEYVVRDLADRADLGEATSVADAPVQAELMPPPVPADAVQQQKLQMQINQDIGAIFGDVPVHPSQGLQNQPYGSMA
jgi:hypothetical protein